MSLWDYICVKIPTILSSSSYIYISLILPQVQKKYIRSFPWMGMLLQCNGTNHVVQHCKEPHSLSISSFNWSPWQTQTLRSCHTKQRKHVDQDVLACSKPPNWQVLVQYMWQTAFQSKYLGVRQSSCQCQAKGRPHNESPSSLSSLIWFIRWFMQ